MGPRCRINERNKSVGIEPSEEEISPETCRDKQPNENSQTVFFFHDHSLFFLAVLATPFQEYAYTTKTSENSKLIDRVILLDHAQFNAFVFLNTLNYQHDKFVDVN